MSPPVLVGAKKKQNQQNSGLWRPGEPQNKSQRKQKRDKYLELARELKKLWLIKMIIRALETIPKSLVKCLEDFEIGGRAKTIQTIVLFKSARIEKSLGDLRRLVVTHPPVKDRHLTLVWKTHIIMIRIIKTAVVNCYFSLYPQYFNSESKEMERQQRMHYEDWVWHAHMSLPLRWENGSRLSYGQIERHKKEQRHLIKNMLVCTRSWEYISKIGCSFN